MGVKLNKFRNIIYFILLCLFTITISCESSKEYQISFPDYFNAITDAEKADWLMSHLSPDSVATTVCDISSGKSLKYIIDNFNFIVRYIYSKYHDKARLTFANEFNRYAGNMSSCYKMKLYYMASRGSGNRLGREYADDLVKDYNKEKLELLYQDMKALDSICKDDPIFYDSFFKVVQSNIMLK